MVSINPLILLVFSAVATNFQITPANQIRFEPAETASGVISSDVSHIFQDRLGFLWIATKEGLAKYDGYQMRVFKHEPFDNQAPSSNDIRKIIEDQQGNIWVIAGDALNRYNRKTDRFVRYAVDAKQTDGLGSRPLDIYCDSRGLIWIGTVDKGLYLYNADFDSFINYGHNPADRTSISSDRVTSIFESRDGTLWFATDGGGLNRFDSETATFSAFLIEAGESDFPVSFGTANIPTNSGYSPIHEDSNGMFWVITLGGGLIELNPRTGKTLSYTHLAEDPDSISDNIISSMFVDKLGCLWLATANGGLDKFNPKTKQVTKFRHDPNNPNSLAPDFQAPFTFAEDRWGQLWIGSKTGGIHVFDNQTLAFRKFRHNPLAIGSLPSLEVNTLVFDQSDTLWVGLESGGLVKYSSHKLKFPGFFGRPFNPGGLPLAEITSIFEDRSDQLWLGTLQQGLLQFEPESSQLIRHIKKAGNGLDAPELLEIRDIVEDSTGLLWLATQQGLFSFQPAQREWQHFPIPNRDVQTIHSLFLDDQQRLWLGVSGDTLFQFNPKQQTFSSITLNIPYDNFWDATITDLTSDGKGNLWIAHSGVGVHFFKPKQGTISTFSISDDDICAIAHPDISSLYQDSSGNLWVGTLGGGVHLLPAGASCFQHLTQKSSGLPSNNIYGILEDKNGNIWVSFYAGLAMLSSRNGRFQAFDAGDGLVPPAEHQAAFFKNQKGVFLLGGVNGFNMFSPHTLSHNPQPPPVVITRFSKMGKTVSRELTSGQALELSYQDNILVFEFAALDFTYPQRNEYMYQLAGFHTDWVQSGLKREAIFTNLDPGQYVFKVKGSNSDGIWSKEPLVLTLKITPPFWKTWWFYALEVIAAILLLITAFIFQKRRLNAQQNEALIALDLKRKTQELEYARHLQLSMIPKENLDLPQLETFGRMRTATEVGGDYYDYFKLDSNKYAMTIGDATGHGFAAGLVVGMTKMSAEVWAMTQQASLQEMLEELNLGLKRSLLEKKMGMALGMITLDLNTLQAEMAFSGMPYPYHYQSGPKKLQTLVMKGPPLGYFERIFVQTQKVDLEPEDYLIFLSDGFLERFNPANELWGHHRLEACLKEICAKGASAERVTSFIYDACDQFASGRHHDDDMTMLVVRFKQQPS